jgi:NitT/TauT family transport system permease protein
LAEGQGQVRVMEEVRVEPVTGARRALPALGAWGLRPGARTALLKSAGWWVLSVGIVTGLWELVAALGWINAIILPPPHEFIGEIRNQAQFLMPKVGVERTGANFVALTAIVASLERVLTGLALAFVAAVVTGGLAFYYDVFGKLSLPTITLLAPIAPVAWIPLAIVAFGIGNGAAIFVVFVGIYFTLTLATVKAMSNVDQVYVNTARVLGGTRRQVMFHVILPAIIPSLFDLTRMNLFGAWMGVLAAEMVGVNTGLGAIIMVGRQMMNMNLTFLGMAMIGLVGYLLDAAFGQVQRRVLWWKGAARL